MTMHTTEVKLQSHSYPVHIGRGLLSDSGTWDRYLSDGRILVVTNEIVAPLYLKRLQQALAGRTVDTLILPDGESNKTVSTWSSVINRLVGMKAQRDTNLIALGGGVIGDIGGFAAAAYMRGVRLLQAPTTLLAQVDSSVGGKTGVNHQQGKNLIGAFYQPSAVIADMDTLETLPDREYRAGLAEVVKYGAISDKEFFSWLESSADLIGNRDGQVLEQLVQSCVRNKAEVVSMDERESGIRAILNFGHSFGHALESLTGYHHYLHGEAVAIGMVLAARLSALRGLCTEECVARLRRLLETFHLPTTLPLSVSATNMLGAIALDKKAVSSGLRLILLREIGQAVIDGDSEKSDILTVIRHSQLS
jgi:3-dehydroquinate synthase